VLLTYNFKIVAQGLKLCYMSLAEVLCFCFDCVVTRLKSYSCFDEWFI